MCGSDLHRPGAEGGIDGVVRHDGDQAPDDGQHQLLADQLLIARIGGVHGHGRVAQHRLGAGGGHREMSRAVRQGILEMPEVTIDLDLFGFLIGQRGAATRTPVDDVLAG